ncbi:PAS domain S-box protein [Natrinema zhouii]|uniref:histidine kinase n=1 Tax=Natrinema zhouii TaxID=1710539 RepID=A0A7D6CT29_9EURY|nr:PAS domain S-box protein [Natrinema zhouii]QLK27293.1 PAS domain S-box protein [Natrinema zhouii]
MPDFEALVEGSPDLFTVLAEDGSIRYQSSGIERVCGYAREDLVGESFLEYVHPDDLERIEPALRKQGQESVEIPIDYRFHHADGSWVWLQLTSGPRQQPETDGYGIVSREIGDRKEWERTIGRYKIILDSLDDGVYAIEPSGEIVYVNDAYAAMKGVDCDDLIGTNIYDWATESAIERIKAAREETITHEGDTGTAEFEFSTIDGGSIPVEMKFSTVSQPGNELERVGVIRDVSERKARERALQRKNERLEEFANIVSHDLRNPLNVAQGNLGLAQEECDSDYLDEVASAHDRMEALIEDLLTLAREGEQVTDPTAVDLGCAIERSWQSVDTADATLVVDTDHIISADASRFQQLVENLVRNAVEHGGHDVTITVGDLEDGFFIEDDGAGILVDERDRVFESGYSTTSDGTGFGLGIVEGIATAHGWSVGVTEGIDGGARFEISDVEFAN